MKQPPFFLVNGLGFIVKLSKSSTKVAAENSICNTRKPDESFFLSLNFLIC
jgi:hypothetical protein